MGNPLYNVPGLGGYVAAGEEIERQQLQKLQQATVVNSLKAALREEAQVRELNEALAASNGDPEKAMNAVIKTGNLAAAAKLAPIVKMVQERRQAEETKKGLSEILIPPTPAMLPPNPMIPGQGASVMAGSGPVVPQPAPQAPIADKQLRREQLNKLAVLYANNPTVQSRVQTELGRLDEAEKPAPLSNLGKYIAERDKHPIGSPERKFYESAIANYKPGGVNITGPLVEMPLGKPAQNKVDEGLLDTTQGLMRLSAIEGQYRPEFQQFSGKLSAGWSSLKEKMGANLAPEDKQFLTDFSAYKRNAINSMNEYIKSITGAAMAEVEAQRILRGMPNPGQGLWDGDSPTEFKAKLDDAMKQTRLALARYEYIKRNGIALTRSDGQPTVPLERMPEIMNGRGRVLEQQFKAANPNATPEQVQSSVRDVLAKEFGLVR